MAFQISPGVRIQEYDLTNIIPAVATSIAASVVPYKWGPLNERVQVTSEKELVNKFWEPTSDNYEQWFSSANYLAYSNNLWTVRVLDEDTALNATSSYTTFTDSNATFTTTANTIDFIDLSEDNPFVVTQEIYLSNGTAEEVLTVTDVNASSNTVTVNTNPTVANGDTSTGSVLGYYGVLVKNDNDFDNNEPDSDFGPWIAKYAGDLGDSLKISVCPSSSAYSNTGFSVTSFDIGNNDPSNTEIGYTGDDLSSLGNTALFVYNGRAEKIVQANSDVFTVNKSFGVTNASVTPGNSAFFAWEFYDEFDFSPGTSTYATNRNGSNDELHIIVIDEDGQFTGEPGTVLERYSALSKASDAKDESGNSIYYKDVINNQSQYVRTVSHPTDNTTNWGTAANGTTYGASTNNDTDSLKSGIDGISTVDNADYLRGIDLFRNGDEIDVSYYITANASSIVINYAIDNLAEYRKDLVVFCGPEKSDVVNISDGSEAVNVVEFRDALQSTSYAFMNCNYKKQYDKYNAVIRWVPINGDDAGLMARTDTLRDPWWSPAGLNRGRYKNIIEFAWNPDEPKRDYLYKNGVNPTLNRGGGERILFGDKTLLKKPSAFDRINVRELFIVIEKAIATASHYQLFEFNDEFTRNLFLNMVEPYLRNVKGRRGVYDFKVVCDETNNTAEVIDRNEFRGDIYIKPRRSINFIDLRFVAVRTGVEFEEIVGQFEL